LIVDLDDLKSIDLIATKEKPEISTILKKKFLIFNPLSMIVDADSLP